jgi:hypothetical protein
MERLQPGPQTSGAGERRAERPAPKVEKLAHPVLPPEDPIADLATKRFLCLACDSPVVEMERVLERMTEPERAPAAGFCATCGEVIEEKLEQVPVQVEPRKPRRAFLRGAVACVAVATSCLLAALVLLTLHAPRFGFGFDPPWFDRALDALGFFFTVFAAGYYLFKLGHMFTEEHN